MSSSSISSSSNSSSSGCCTALTCIGSSTICSHFSGWTFTGMSYSNSDNCKLYVIFDYIGLLQKIEIYKDSSYVNLVAAGQGTTGAITLSDFN